MCTMTWWIGDGEYEVYFNRDELKSRSRALPPEERVAVDGCRYLSPTDPDAGGTWMLVNQHGVTVCLLNLWHQNFRSDGDLELRSRGQLVLDFAAVESAAEAVERLQKMDCRCYRPFSLVSVDHSGARLLEWDGEQLRQRPAVAPLTSSSYCFEAVKMARGAQFQTTVDGSVTSFQRYHAGTAEPTAFTVRMNRPDAQTWSRSGVYVTHEMITWHYVEEMPDLQAAAVEHLSSLKKNEVE